MQPCRSGPPPLKLACRPPSALTPPHCRLPIGLVGDRAPGGSRPALLAGRGSRAQNSLRMDPDAEIPDFPSRERICRAAARSGGTGSDCLGPGPAPTLPAAWPGEDLCLRLLGWENGKRKSCHRRACKCQVGVICVYIKCEMCLPTVVPGGLQACPQGSSLGLRLGRGDRRGRNLGLPSPRLPQRSGLQVRAGRPGPKPHQPGLGHICPLWVPASSTDHQGGQPGWPPRAPPAWWPRVLAGCPAVPSPGAMSLEGPLSWLPVSPRGAQ